MLANLLANCGNSCNTHKGYEHLESERDDVNGLPELWDIDRLAGYLSVSKHFAYPPLLPRVFVAGQPGAVTNRRSGGTRQVGNGPNRSTQPPRPTRQSGAEGAERRGTADPTGRRLLSGWWEKWMATRHVIGSTRARDESIRTCQTEPVFGK
jgi:hypothetical protein